MKTPESLFSCYVIKKETPTQVLSCRFSQEHLFYRTPPVPASCFSIASVQVNNKIGFLSSHQVEVWDLFFCG